jgi:hypothetical protein
MKKVIYFLLSFVVLTSCSKENSDSFFPYPNNPVNDTAWVQQVPAITEGTRMMESLIATPQADSFNGATGGVLNFPEAIQISFLPNTLRFVNGPICTSKVKLEMIALRKKGDMVRYQRPTTSFGRLLETGGAFFIKATSGGQELELVTPSLIKIRYRTVTTNPAMSVFYGIQNPVGNLPPGTNPAFTWVPATDSSSVRPFIQQDSSGISRGYELFSQRLRWINCDYFTDTTIARTRLNVILPPNYTNTNTNVFAVFDNENIVVQLNSEFSSRSFYSVNIPIGKQIKIISLSKVGDRLFLGSKQLTTSNSLPITVQPELKTKPQIEQYLSSL